MRISCVHFVRACTICKTHRVKISAKGWFTLRHKHKHKHKHKNCKCEPAQHKHKHKHKKMENFPFSYAYAYVVSTSISMSAVFLSAEKHESRVQSRSKTKKWRLNLKKNRQRLYENIPLCTINSLPTSKINPREFFHKMIFANAYISLSWC